ncbi:MAG: NUDIX domain-containing protein [Hyphomicrobiales bacterium]
MGAKVQIRSTEILADAAAVTKTITFQYRAWDGADVVCTREVYDPGDAAAVLPFDEARATVLLTRQMRLPAWLHGAHESLLEACAGRIGAETPKACILREAREEMGYALYELQEVFQAYASPGYSTEKITCFLAAYDPSKKISEGGGLEDEGEHIEIVELDLDLAFEMIGAGKIVDAKTIMLLQHLKLSLQGQ